MAKSFTLSNTAYWPQSLCIPSITGNRFIRCTLQQNGETKALCASTTSYVIKINLKLPEENYIPGTFTIQKGDYVESGTVEIFKSIFLNSNENTNSVQISINASKKLMAQPYRGNRQRPPIQPAHSGVEGWTLNVTKQEN